MKLRIAIFSAGVSLGGLWLSDPTSRPDGGPAPASLARATFAGGCFWCMEAPFDKVRASSRRPRVRGGREKNPTYEQVAAAARSRRSPSGRLRPRRVSYAQLVEVFWRNVDPRSGRPVSATAGPVPHAGSTRDTQKRQRRIEAGARASGRLPKPIVTEIVPSMPSTRRRTTTRTSTGRTLSAT